jgi:hypothetical protein
MREAKQPMFLGRGEELTWLYNVHAQGFTVPLDRRGVLEDAVFDSLTPPPVDDEPGLREMIRASPPIAVHNFAALHRDFGSGFR